MSERGKGALVRLIERVMGRSVAGPVDHLARYEGRVVKQSSDGRKVDVQLDVTGIPSPSGVELRHGLPGVTVHVAAGARVLVGWVGGDPRLPFAELWRDGASVTKIVLDASLIEIAGNGYSLVKTEDLLADIKVLVDDLLAVLATNCVNGSPLVGWTTSMPTIATRFAALSAKLDGNAYKSSKAKNG